MPMLTSPKSQAHADNGDCASPIRRMESIPPSLQPLMSRIETAYRPLEVWLFGSRARGEATSQSDWDLLVVLADDAADELLDPMYGWTVQRNRGVYADILCARRREF